MVPSLRNIKRITAKGYFSIRMIRYFIGEKFIANFRRMNTYKLLAEILYNQFIEPFVITYDHPRKLPIRITDMLSSIQYRFKI